MASQDMNISAGRSAGKAGISKGVGIGSEKAGCGVSVGATCSEVHAHQIGSTDNEAHQKCNCNARITKNTQTKEKKVKRQYSGR